MSPMMRNWRSALGVIDALGARLRAARPREL